MQWRIEQRSDLVVLQRLDCLLAQGWRVVDEIVVRQALHAISSRLGRERLRLGELFTRNVRGWYRRIDDGPNRFTGNAVIGIREVLLRSLDDDRYFLAIDVDVHQNRRRRRVIVPDVMFDELCMPRAFASCRVERDQAGAVQVVARVETAVVINRDTIGRDVNDAAFLVC